MRHVYFIVGCFLLLACEKPKKELEKNVVEIYLLKKHIPSSEGVPILDVPYFRERYERDTLHFNRFKDANYDTIDSIIIAGGKFSVTQADMKGTPLVFDNEVVGFNLKTSSMTLKKSAIERIAKIYPSISGTQFVMCVNKKPCLTGYWVSMLSSLTLSWNHIIWIGARNTQEDYTIELTIEQNESNRFYNPCFTDLNEYPELLKAFKNSGRLIE